MEIFYERLNSIISVTDGINTITVKKRGGQHRLIPTESKVTVHQTVC